MHQEMMLKSLIGAMFLLIYYNWRYLLINWLGNLIWLFRSTAGYLNGRPASKQILDTPSDQQDGGLWTAIIRIHI